MMQMNREKERAEEILAYIHAHYHEKISVDDIAKKLNLSRSECFRCFKLLTEKSLVEYINEYRLKKAAGLLRETTKTVTEICTECGFENSSYFGKLFKDAFAITPFKYRKAQIFTEKFWKKVGGFDYEYWKNEGTGSMSITGDETNGSFQCEWSIIDKIIFRGGKKFLGNEKTHEQLGQISVSYEAAYNPYGDAWLCIYGWAIKPLVEWYIIERYSTYKPPNEGFLVGRAEIDGDVYEIFRTDRKKRPSVFGDFPVDFSQYWSVRTTGRTSGTVDVSAHFRAWASLGLALGSIAEIALSVEAWLSSGDVEVVLNEIVIAGAGDAF
jgi:AraC-like DNA-binding protein